MGRERKWLGQTFRKQIDLKACLLSGKKSSKFSTKKEGRKDGRKRERKGGKGNVPPPPTVRNKNLNQGGGWRWEREEVSAGVGWRDGEKRHTTVIE